MPKASLNQLLKFPCPHCREIRRVSVEIEMATVILPKSCPTRTNCETEVLRRYYLTMGERDC
jgi:hypothetical protein